MTNSGRLSARGHGVVRFVGMVAAIAAAIAVAVGVAAKIPANGRSIEPEVPQSFSSSVATPPGITLQPLGRAQGYSLDKLSAAKPPRDEFVYADQRGMTLYTFAGPDARADCADECGGEFLPLIAMDGAQPFGDWTLSALPDGSRQWVLRGRPLFTYVKDVDPGSVAGNSPAMTGAPRLDGAGRPVGGGYRGAFQGDLPEPNVLPQGWQVAQFYPISNIELPPGLSIQELPDAGAFVLTDYRSHTLYANDGAVAVGPDTGFVPLPAPLLARPFGAFGILDREDGIRQWTWQGQGLFTYSKDLAPGYANGAKRDDQWKVAAIYRLFMPAGVTIEDTLKKGAVLAANGGRTLYRRDGHILQSGGGHNLRRGAPPRPAVGRDIGTDPRCAGQECELWRPFLAPDDAIGRGFWSVTVREDGKKQWAYQGYAMWLHDGDKAPGDMNGHDIYDITLSHDATQIVDLGTPMDGGAALWWSIADP